MSKINNIHSRRNKEWKPKASPKPPEIEKALNAISALEGGIPRIEAIETMRCAKCLDEIFEDSFRDQVSKDEYEISGLCQPCQDNSYDPDLHKALSWLVSVDFD
jgi:hypothetical protein